LGRTNSNGRSWVSNFVKNLQHKNKFVKNPDSFLFCIILADKS
jgi:hypothetical protein